MPRSSAAETVFRVQQPVALAHCAAEWSTSLCCVAAGAHFTGQPVALPHSQCSMPWRRICCELV